MGNLFDSKSLSEEVEKYKIEDEKKKYIFRANTKYIFSSSIFFIVIIFIASSSLYKGITGVEKLSGLKIILILILFLYVFVSIFLIFSYKIVFENDAIFVKKLKIEVSNIESATVKVAKVSAAKIDKVLEIITFDNKRVQIRLNIKNEILLLKLLKNRIGGKLIFKI